MKAAIAIMLFLLIAVCSDAQTLALRHRHASSLSGSAFAQSISDPSLTLEQRENKIFDEIKQGNVPKYIRHLSEIIDTMMINGDQFIIKYWVLPDYIAIGSNEDFFYCPMTPMLAQRVANLTKAHLPTKKIVDEIYRHAVIKLVPKPIPPTPAMTTIPVFMAHNDTVRHQLQSMTVAHTEGKLTAGNKKDIIISNQIYGQNIPRVVIYGWHTAEGKPIQPIYNKHKNTWADYSHGVRLVQDKMYVNGKRTTYQQILADPVISSLLSDEGTIEQPVYPISSY